ncbi:MAG TPA: peroxide stress protein YaaA, partial [Phycicoccus sp.]|nr:peroxide stress protein YaaA [Phycicoccus sp.]
GRGLVIDCRSSTYAVAWSPSGAQTDRWVQIHVPGATHMAKHTRGLVAAAICQLDKEPRTPAALAEVLATSTTHSFDVQLAAPARPGRPWQLSVSPR